MYKITVRRRGPNGCIGAGPCMDEAPNTFAFDDDNIAIVTNPTGDDDAAILRAAKSCPVEAIVIDDENGNRIFPLE